MRGAGSCWWLPDTSRLLFLTSSPTGGRRTARSMARSSSWDNGSGTYFLDWLGGVIGGRSPLARHVAARCGFAGQRRCLRQGKRDAVLTGELSNDALKPTKGAVDGARLASLRAAPLDLH
jgi:hypothetical protein